MTHEERENHMKNADNAARNFFNLEPDAPLSVAAQNYRQGFFDAITAIITHMEKVNEKKARN